MTTIEQLAKEFSKGNPEIEAAFLAGAKQFGINISDRLRLELNSSIIDVNSLYDKGYWNSKSDMVTMIEELL